MAFKGTPEDRHRGEAIRALRLAYGLTEEELAAAAGIGRRHLSYIERGDRRANLILCRKIADALGVRLAAITIEGCQPVSEDADGSAA